MARHRSRSYSPPRHSRSPPPRDRKRSGDGGADRRDRRSPGPTGLLVRNLPLDARPEDLRTPFERFGPVKDVYIPKNYHTGEPRGFGFVKYRHADDAAEAKQQLNHSLIGGREIRIVFAEENRKTPQEMRTTSRSSGSNGGSHRRRTPPRSTRRRYRSYSRSPSPVRDRKRRDDYRSPVRSRSVSRSPPLNDRNHRRSFTRSPQRGDRGYSRSRSPIENDKIPANGREARSRSRSLPAKTRSPSRSRSRSLSPR